MNWFKETSFESPLNEKQNKNRMINEDLFTVAPEK